MRLMKPWIILAAISLIGDLANLLKAVVRVDPVDGMASALALLLGAYSFLVVWSHKAEVEEDTEGGSTNNGEEMQKEYV